MKTAQNKVNFFVKFFLCQFNHGDNAGMGTTGNHCQSFGSINDQKLLLEYCPHLSAAVNIFRYSFKAFNPDASGSAGLNLSAISVRKRGGDININFVIFV